MKNMLYLSTSREDGIPVAPKLPFSLPALIELEMIEEKTPVITE